MWKPITPTGLGLAGLLTAGIGSDLYAENAYPPKYLQREAYISALREKKKDALEITVKSGAIDSAKLNDLSYWSGALHTAETEPEYLQMKEAVVATNEENAEKRDAFITYVALPSMFSLFSGLVWLLPASGQKERTHSASNGSISVEGLSVEGSSSPDNIGEVVERVEQRLAAQEQPQDLPLSTTAEPEKTYNRFEMLELEQARTREEPRQTKLSDRFRMLELD